MGRTRFVLLAVIAAFIGALAWAGPAAAATVPIDAMDDSPGSRWVPPNVTIDTGDTVRWEFDEAQTSHTVNSLSTNWTLSSGSKPPDSAPVEHTFDAPGTYTFLCQIHPGTMTGSVTVEGGAPAEPLQNVLVFSKTAGFRHESIPNGIAAIEELGTQNDFDVDATEDSAVFTDANLAQYDVIVFLSTTGDILTDDQQAAFERFIQAGGGFAGIHAAADTEYTWPWYGEMLGGYFRNHPPGTPTASVDIEDGDEPSTTGLPTRWTRTDEWYNFQNPVNPVVNGGGDDYSPRNSDVKVLATVDESTYDEQDGNATDDDHPVSWCSEFDGGHVWYTAMGHTNESFNTAEGNLRSHILGGLRTAAGVTADCGDPREASPSASDFEKITLDDDTQNPFELDIAPDGRVFYIERDGRLMVWKPGTGQTVQVGSVPVTQSQENGLLGLQLAPNFATTGHIYMSYSALPDNSNQNRLSRFTVQGDAIVAGSEQIIYTWQHQRAECCHTSGSLAFAPDGSLYISTGDNTNPFASDGFAPIDERPGREAWDAQRSSANTNNPNGKILHIVPKPDAAGAPGIGATYEIPAGNMFPVGTAQTLPEIFAMGFRNPFRITVDPTTGWVLMGDYGPDAPQGNANRGPQGSVEYNVVKEPGFYGWPYCVRQNTPYNDYNFATGASGPQFNCNAPVNNSPNNTGLTNLPPAKPATMWMGYSDTDARFPLLGGGGAPTGGPRYDFDPALQSDTKFPEFYDGQWFIGEWNNGWIKTATLDAQGAATAVSCFVTCANNQFPGDGYLRPMDMEFGPDGSLYVIEWGSGFGGNNADSGIYRIDYIKGSRKPIAHASANPDSGTLPLTVQFSSEGSIDPEGTSLTYAWDFDGDGDTDSTDPNPTHTYETAGTFGAKLTVTDQSGMTGIDTVPIVAGNSRPQITIEVPENGKVAQFGDIVPYEITVTDAEDGSTGDGTIDCQDVTLNISLGHDQHAHELSEQQGCTGTFQTATDSGHGNDANIFTVIEATYTDEGAGAAGPVTGRDEAILQPKFKQAEYWLTTGRTADGRGGGDPGVANETTADTGGGSAAAFIEDGDWISFDPYNLEDLDSVTFRVASGGDGGVIELRYDSADGPLVAATPQIPPTGGWQTWTNVDLDLPETVPDGTHRLFIVFRHPTSTGGLMNLNWFRFAGKGAGNSAPPVVSAAADPDSGEAPLEVAFDGTATDPDAEAGEQLTYAWNFGVPGTTDDTSTELDPTYTYERPGDYTATFTATDPHGAKASASVQVRVTSGDQCPTGTRSDEFAGDALDANRWTVIRPDGTRPPTVSGGSLHFPIDNGSLYGPGTSARNIVVQDLPSGEVEVTAKITTEPLTENYQQAGLRVYSGDDHWASVHMISAGGSRDFEFIYENNGTPRNEAADKLGGIPADSPNTYYVRLTSDGSTLTASYSFDGDEFLPVGRPASLAAFVAPKIGPVALSDQAPTFPVADFDWIRFDPDEGGGGGGGGGNEVVDDFDGTQLGSAWTVVRGDQSLVVGGGSLQIPAAPGDIYAGRNDAKNLVTRDAPDGPWTATAKVNFEGTAQYHQGGIMVYGDDQNFTKFGRIAHTTAGDEKFEFIYENNGTPRNEAADSTTNIPATFPDDFWVRMVSDGTNVTGAYSTDGTTWTPVGRPAPLPADAKLGLFAFSNDGTGNPVAAFDSFALETEGGGGPVGPSRDDQFEGSSLDKTRWNAIVRDVPEEYAVADGKLTITTGPGDIYTADSVPPPDNFILQSADHAGADWVIETKIDGATIDGGYGQGGLLAYSTGDNWVKFNAIADAGQTRINRLELRSETNGTPVGPATPPDPPVAEGAGEIWLRLTKAGQSYTGEYSFDGSAWSSAGTVTNAMAAPLFGLYAFGPQAAGQGDIVPFEYFTLDGEDSGGGCECVSTGDEFGGGSLDKAKWNSIVREDDANYSVEDGSLHVTTVGGDIYSSPDTAANTRNFLLQTPDHAGADWVIETKVSGSLSGGYEQGGLLAYLDDQNYVKFDLISDDGTTAVNRIELRSEEGGTVQNPQPQVTPLPAGTTAAWLRLTKTGDQYKGEYSFDGETWTALAETVQNDMAAPRFGLFTLGVNSPGGEVVFDYFAIDGERGCEEPPPTNTPPVLGDVTATPTSGFAPLEVDFTAAATDADEDELTYSWDFDGDGTADAATADASHTYTEAGVYDAEVTVSDGEAERSKTVQITVLGPDEPGARFRTLVFSETTGFRHASIPDGIAAIEQLGAANDFQVDATEDSTVFRDAVLSRYDTVVFLSTTGDPLTDDQQAAFERYIRAGGGFTGIHAAADTEYEWTWYGKLVGGYFLSHPPGTPDATVDIEDTEHHSTQGLPNPWPRTDEWYNYKSPDFADPNVPDGDYSPRAGGVHVLATVDESTYDEQDGNATDDDHPISWCQRYDGGRSWYTGMGHTSESFNEAAGNIRSHILGGLEVTAGVASDAECGDETGIQVQAFADPASGPAPLTVNFSATGLDPDGDELTYKWTFPDGTAFGPSVTRTLRTPGPFTATVTVTDADGNSASDEVTVTVGEAESEPPEIIEAAADDPEGQAPHRVLFHAVAEDPEGGELTYLWDFGDGGSAFGDEVEHTYLEAGSFTATVTVTDETGESASQEIEITVTDPPGNRPPSVEGAAAPASGKAPLEVLFTAQGSDPDGDTLTYRWDFGDGSAPASGRTARHTFTKNGTFTATVTATDRAGATGTATVQVTVGNPAGGQPPSVQIAADRTTGVAPLAVNFSAAGSDPDGDAIMYTWAFGDGGTAGGTRVAHTYSTPGTYTATVTVTDAGGKTGTASTTITVTGALQIAGAQQAKATLRALSRPSLGTFRTRGLKIAATCAQSGEAAVGLWATKAGARKLGLASRGLGRAKLRCEAGRTLRMRIAPAKKVRLALKARRPASLRVTVALAMRDGAPLTRTLTLKR